MLASRRADDHVGLSQTCPSGPETDMSRQCLLRGISALVKSQKQWAMRCEAQQNGLLELLLQGMEDQDLTTSTVCIEVRA